MQKRMEKIRKKRRVHASGMWRLFLELDLDAINAKTIFKAQNSSLFRFKEFVDIQFTECKNVVILTCSQVDLFNDFIRGSKSYLDTE